MKFLIDAQLPRRLAEALNERGHDAMHTLDLPDQNATTDQVVAATADRESRTVVSKDEDFRNSLLLVGTPHRLLHVRTGNISNDALVAIVSAHLVRIESAFETAAYAELTSDALIVHTDMPE